jgi:iron(III) transport system substrate-binding protein
MRKRLKTLLVALGIAAGLTATAAAQEPPAVALLADAAAKAKLKELIAAASKEGAVSYIDTVLQPTTHAALAEGFRAYYGLPASFKVAGLTQAPGNVITRLQQEMNANKLTFDVGSVASPPWIYARIKDGKIAKYDSPEYPAYKRSFELGLGKDGYFAFNGAYYFVPMWNGESTKSPGDSWMDVLEKAPKGRMNSNDPSVSDSALLTYIGLRQVFPLEMWAKLASLEPTILYRSEQIANRLIAGEDLFAWNGMPTRAWQFNQKGAKLEFLRPKEGVVVLPQSTFILAAAPNPNAARLWYDYTLSEAGQKILTEREVLISGRSGFKSPHPAYVPPLEEIKAIKVDWEKLTEDDLKKARDEWKSVSKKQPL